LDCGGFNPSAVAYDGGKGAVFVANYGSNSVSVISDAPNPVLTTIPVGTRPYGVAYDSGKGEVFVSNQLSNNVSVISDATNTVVATIPVGTHPLGIAYDSRKGEVFVINSNSNNVSVVSDMNNAVVTTIPVGFNPLDVAYDSGKGEVFVTNANSNNVSVISDATDTVVATVAVGSGPAGLAFDASNGYVYLSNTAQGTLSTLSANAPPTDYPVTFTESGLPAGTDWSVTLAGTTNSSMTPTIGFREPNGTYSFTVRSVAGGYTATPSTGSLNVSAASVSEAVTFSSSNGSSSSGFLGLPGNTGYYLLGGVAILVAAGAAVALVLRVRRK
jgi:YVTN family beta-propeller protein